MRILFLLVFCFGFHYANAAFDINKIKGVGKDICRSPAPNIADSNTGVCLRAYKCKKKTYFIKYEYSGTKSAKNYDFWAMCPYNKGKYRQRDELASGFNSCRPDAFPTAEKNAAADCYEELTKIFGEDIDKNPVSGKPLKTSEPKEAPAQSDAIPEA